MSERRSAIVVDVAISDLPFQSCVGSVDLGKALEWQHGCIASTTTSHACRR